LADVTITPSKSSMAMSDKQTPLARIFMKKKRTTSDVCHIRRLKSRFNLAVVTLQMAVGRQDYPCVF
jgi:hypothetical protein